MISKQAVLEIIRNHHRRFEISLISQLERNINDLPSISEDGFKRDIIFKLSLALSDYFNDDELSLIKQCLNKLIPVPISDGWISVETPPEDRTTVICYIDSKTGHEPFIKTLRYYNKRDGWEDYDTVITHWHPLLPAPTK